MNSNLILLVPDAEGKFAEVPNTLTGQILRSGVAGAIPSKDLHVEGQYSYNYADDVFYVRRGDMLVKYARVEEVQIQVEIEPKTPLQPNPESTITHIKVPLYSDLTLTLEAITPCVRYLEDTDLYLGDLVRYTINAYYLAVNKQPVDDFTRKTAIGSVHEIFRARSMSVRIVCDDSNNPPSVLTAGLIQMYVGFKYRNRMYEIYFEVAE